MRKKRTVVILLIIVLYCIIPLYLSLHKKTVVYSSPEEYCVSNGYDYYQITWGESSAFAMYKKAAGKVGFKILQKTEKGFETVRYQIVSTVFCKNTEGKRYGRQLCFF